MPILGSSNSAANKDMMSKLLTTGDNSKSDWVENIWEKEKLLVTCNFSISHNVFMRQNEYLWSKGIITVSLYFMILSFSSSEYLKAFEKILRESRKCW